MRTFTFLSLIVTEIAAISIQIPNTSIALGRMDIVINCLVNDSTVESIIAIQLRRSNANIVSILEYGVSWQDKKVENRGDARGSVAAVLSSYLQMTISRQNVGMDDAGTYSCQMSGQKRDKSIILEESAKIFVNITEVKNIDMNGCTESPEASTFISLEITNVVNDCEEGYTEISCISDGRKITHIQLERLGKSIVQISDKQDISWQDAELMNRSGVSLNASVSDVGVSYLSVKIMRSDVRPTKDEGSYQCNIIGLDDNNGLISKKSTVEMLNIIVSECSQRTDTSQVNIRTQSEAGNYTNEDDHHMGMYRAVVLGTGAVICCFLAVIMMREICLHNCISDKAERI